MESLTRREKRDESLKSSNGLDSSYLIPPPETFLSLAVDDAIEYKGEKNIFGGACRKKKLSNDFAIAYTSVDVTKGASFRIAYLLLE